MTSDAHSPYAALPMPVAKIVKAAIDHTRAEMNEGHGVKPAAFVCNSDTGLLTVVIAHFEDESDKDAFSTAIQGQVKKIDADVVVLIAESWALPRELGVEKALALLDKYGSISACPERVEVVHISVETNNAYYISQPKIENRSFGEPSFTKVGYGGGRFTQFLSRSTNESVH